jgi:hypothetical protein
MEDFASLLKLHEAEIEGITPLSKALCDADEETDRAIPELTEARARIEAIMIYLEKLFPEGLTRSIQLAAESERIACDEAEAQGY